MIDAAIRRRSRVVCAVPTVVLVLGLAMACGGDPPPPATPDPLAPVVDLVVARLATADDVAGAKWRTGGSITDPAREQAVVDAARAGAVSRGLDPEAVATVFRDQIEANKVVQYGLFSAWSADPTQAPSTTPDLSAIRPRLDRITTQLLDALAATRDLRVGAGCPLELGQLAAAHRAADPIHQRGLDRALASVCR